MGALEGVLGYPSRECLILLCRPLSHLVLPFPVLMLLTSFSNLDAEGVGQDEVLPGMHSFFDNELRGEGFWQKRGYVRTCFVQVLGVAASFSPCLNPLPDCQIAWAGSPD